MSAAARAAAEALESVLNGVPGTSPARSSDLVGLTDLPLPDHTRGQHGGVAEARAAYAAEREAALTRDERAQRAQELQDARDEGYRAGLVDGRAAAEAEGLGVLQALPGQISAALEQTATTVDEAARALAGDVLEAALEVARWVLAREVSIDEEALLGVVAQALKEAGGMGGAELRVPAELGLAATRWSSRFGVDRPRIVEDPAVPAGTVVVRSASGGSATVSLPVLIARALEALGTEDPDRDAGASAAHGGDSGPVDRGEVGT